MYVDRTGLAPINRLLPNRAKSIGAVLGAECVAVNCKKSSAPSRSYLDAYGDCMSILNNYMRENPELDAAVLQILGGQHAVLDGCARICERGTNSEKYKKQCRDQNACFGNGGSPIG